MILMILRVFRARQGLYKDLAGHLKEGFTLGVIDNALEAEGFDPDVLQLLL